MAKFERNACTRQTAGEIMRRNIEIDVRPLLSAIDVPTMVIHNDDDPLIPVALARQLAEDIPGATYVEGRGDYHCTWATREFRPLMDRALAFLADGGPQVDHDGPARPLRSVATILFTDIVGSTDKAAAMGDEAWGAVLGTHHRRASEATQRAGGSLVKTTGDGILALFDGPSRAIQAVAELQRAVADLDLRLRAGIHTGEVDRSADDVSGIGVHIAARVMAMADADEVIATRTVRELSAGSGIVFTDRGAHELRGIPGEWDLYAVSPPERVQHQAR